MLDPLAVLTELVAIPSVNPMGRDVAGPPYGEERLTAHLEQLLRGLGLRVERQAAEPGRDNLLARLDGRTPPEKGGPLLLLDAHQDTVPVEGMTVEPFRPAVRDGRLYGRGACDVKGGMAAILAAVARLAEERPAHMPTLLLSFTVNEEHGFSGARALAGLCGKMGTGTSPPTQLAVHATFGSEPVPVSPEVLPRRPDAAIVVEPTELDVVVAHKGVVRWKCHTLGRAAHSARPEAGENAIYRMARVLARVEQYARELARLEGHPLCGPHTASVGTIRGGLSVNTVPDRCTIEIDRRLPPGAKPQAARQALIDDLAELGTWIAHDPPFMQAPPLDDAHNGPLGERLSQAVFGVKGDCRRIGVPYATNAAFYSAAGVPTVVFGPGSLAQAHTADEWIAVDAVQMAAEVLYRLCSRWE